MHHIAGEHYSPLLGQRGEIGHLLHVRRGQDEHRFAVAAAVLEEIGKVIHVEGFGPHRLGAAWRPKWFFEKEKYGGILCDIGSHQIEQYLHFAGEEDAAVQLSRIGNYAHPEYPELEDFGDCSIVGRNGSTNYFRVDWFNPDGLRTWGDGRTFILGTEGFIEIRKYVTEQIKWW